MYAIYVIYVNSNDSYVSINYKAGTNIEDIEKDIMDTCNGLEKNNLDDMPTRNREITMRISLIVAVMDSSDEIKAQHVSWSWILVKALYKQYINEIRRHVGGSDYEKAKMEALTSLRRKSPLGVPVREFAKTSPWSKWNKKMRDEIVNDLRDSSLAEFTKVKTGDRGPGTQMLVAIE